MKKNLLTFFAILATLGVAKGQFLPYNYTVNANLNRGVGNDTTANGINSKYYESPRSGSTAIEGRFFPNITNGAYKLRAIAYQPTASFNLSGDKLTINNSTTGIAKLAWYNIINATGVVKFAFNLDLTQYVGEKEFVVAFGNTAVGSTLTNSSSLTAAAATDIFASFRIVKSGANLVTQYRSSDGTANTNATGGYLIKPLQSQQVEIFVNSTASEIIYTYGTPVVLSPNTYHVYVDGAKYAETFPKVGASYTQPVINALSVAYAGGIQEKVSLSNLSATYLTETNLPVSLLSFSGAKVATGVELKWQTASEQNNQYFEVLKSTNGKDFFSVATVKGAGNSNTLKSYSLVDSNPIFGYNYYKLKQVDNNGETTVFDNNIVAINYNLATETVSAFLQNNNLVLNLIADKITEGTVKIYNTQGQLLNTQKINLALGANTFSIDISNLVKGIYLAKVDFDKTSKVVKIVK